MFLWTGNLILISQVSVIVASVDRWLFTKVQYSLVIQKYYWPAEGYFSLYVTMS